MLQFLIPLIMSLIKQPSTAGMLTKSPITGAMGTAPSAMGQAFQSVGGWGGLVSSMLGGSPQKKPGIGFQDFGTPQPQKQFGAYQQQGSENDFFIKVILPLLLKQMR